MLTFWAHARSSPWHPRGFVAPACSRQWFLGLESSRTTRAWGHSPISGTPCCALRPCRIAVGLFCSWAFSFARPGVSVRGSARSPKLFLPTASCGPVLVGTYSTPSPLPARSLGARALDLRRGCICACDARERGTRNRAPPPSLAPAVRHGSGIFAARVRRGSRDGAQRNIRRGGGGRRPCWL